MRKCFICNTNENEAEHLIGIEFNPLDQERDDVFLCGDCITSAAQVLDQERFKKAVKEIIKELTEEGKDDEIEISEK
jgi:hypothetical protein